MCLFWVLLKKYVPRYLYCMRGLPDVSYVEKCMWGEMWMAP